MSAASLAGRVLRPIAWMAFAALAYGFLVLIYLMAFHWDLEERRAGAERKADVLEAEARNLEVTESKLPEFHEEAHSLEAKLALLNRIVPPDPLHETVVLRLTTLARKTGVVLLEATPGPARVARGESHAVLPWTLKVRGRLAEMEAFVARVPRLSRLVQVRSLALERAGAAGYLATLAVDAFQHVPEDATPRAAAVATKPCERDEAALFFSSDVVAGVELVGEERSEVPKATEVVKHYRITDVFKGTLQPGDSVDVTQTCVVRSTPLGSGGYPWPVELCPEVATQAEGPARLLFAQTLSSEPGGLSWETPRLGGAALACRGSASSEEMERARAWRTQRSAPVG